LRLLLPHNRSMLLFFWLNKRLSMKLTRELNKLPRMRQGDFKKLKRREESQLMKLKSKK